MTLEAFQYTDINRALNLDPGVYAREEDGFGLRPNIGLRGGTADRSAKVVLMEDGVLIGPAPYSAPAAYFFPLARRMVGIEVFKGPASIEFGPQTIGGAINMISAPIPNDSQGSVELSAGSYGYRHLHARGGGQTESGTGYLAEFMHFASDGFKELDGGGDTGFSKNELILKGSREIGSGTLELRLTYADEISDETYLGLTQADFDANPLRRYQASALDRMEWDWYSGRIDWKQRWLDGDLTVTGYTQRLDRAWRKFNNFAGADIRLLLANPDSPVNQLFVNELNGADTDGVSGSPDDIRSGTNDRSFVASGLQAQQRWKFGERVKQTLSIGARWHVDRVRRLHDEFGFEQSNGRIFENDQPRDITTDNTGYTQALSLRARDEIRSGKWTVVPGLRVEAIGNSFTNRLVGAKNDNDYLVILPGIGAIYSLNESIDLVLGAHEGFSPATPSLTRNLDPESSLNYEVGARWRSKFGRFEAIGFLNDYSNLTAICTISSGCLPSELDTQTNAGEVRTQGLEFGWNHQFEFGPGLRVPVLLSYTYTDAEFQEAFFSTNPQFGDVQAGFELPYVPANRANMTIGLTNETWTVNLSATYVDRMRDVAGSGDFLNNEGSDAYTVVDLAAHYDWSDRLRFSARVDNVADNEYVVARRPFGARPGKPRTLQLVAAWKY